MTRRHGRFFVALAIGLAVLVLSMTFRWDLRVLLAGDGFFIAYLGLMAAFGRGLTPDGLRARAEAADEGLAVILLLTGVAIALSIGAIFVLLNRPPGEGPVAGLVGLLSVPLGWFMLHTLAAYHYAHLYYAPGVGGDRDLGGIDFPGTPEPALGDFLYLAFVIGMTAQVSDTAISGGRMRRAVLVHAVAAFFYNSVLIALLVNAAISLAG